MIASNLSSFRHREHLAPLLAAQALAAAFVVVGVATGFNPLIGAGLVGTVMVVVVAVARPDLIAGAAVLTLAVVPIYAAPSVGPFSAYIPVLLCWLAAAVLSLRVLLQQHRVTPGFVDAAVGVYALLSVLPVLFGARDPTEYVDEILFQAIGPYLAIRLLLVRQGLAWLPLAFAATALLALPFVAYETLTSNNPFSGIVLNAGVAEVWGDSQERFGALRAEGAFGHAIALSQFSATVMILTIGAAVLATNSAASARWVAGTLVGGTLLAMSLSRTGWVVLAIGLVLVVLGVVRGPARLRLISTMAAITVLGGAALFATGLDATLFRLFGDDELDNSNNYRRILLERALRGDGLAWFGMRNSPIGYGIEGGPGSVDNAYLVIAADWGYVGLLGLLGIMGAVAAQLWRLRGTFAALFPAVTLANFAGIFQVAIITQTQFWLWMLIGASAAAAEMRQPAATPGADPTPSRGSDGPGQRQELPTPALSAAAVMAALGDAVHRLLGLLSRYRFLLLTGLAVTAAAAALFSASRPTRYAATASIVAPVETLVYDDWRDSQAARIENADEAAVAFGTAAELAAQELRNVSAEQVVEWSTVTFNPDSDVIDVQTVTGDPVLSARIANAYGRSFITAARDRAESQIETALSRATRLHASLPAEQRARRDGTDVQGRLTAYAVRQSLSRSTAALIGPARPPAEPSSPKPVHNGMVGGVLGGICALLFAGLLDARRRRTPGSSEVEEFFGAPVIARVPRLSSLTTLGDRLALTGAQRDALMALRVNLRRLSRGRSPGNVVITNTGSAEVRMATARALAEVMVTTGDSVVLVQTSRVRRAARSTRPIGLSSVLLGESLDSTLGRVEVISPAGRPRTLDVLPAGPPLVGSSQLFDMTEMRDLLRDLRSRYDTVLIEGPPILFATGIDLALDELDGVVVVATSGRTSSSDAAAFNRSLGDHANLLIGVVIAYR